MKYLAWLDLETASSVKWGDEHQDPILEIALVVTGMDLEEVVSMRAVCDPSTMSRAYRGWKTRMGPVVAKMHRDNGLLREVDEGGVGVRDAEQMALSALRRCDESGEFRLAGSGVSHFDLRFLRAQMPTLVEALTIPPLDLGSVRRFIRDVAERPDLIYVSRPSKVSHRAEPDVKNFIREARLYRRYIGVGFRGPTKQNPGAQFQKKPRIAVFATGDVFHAFEIDRVRTVCGLLMADGVVKVDEPFKVTPRSRLSVSEPCRKCLRWAR